MTERSFQLICHGAAYRALPEQFDESYLGGGGPPVNAGGESDGAASATHVEG